MIEHSLPRFVQVKTLSGGQRAFYWIVTGHYRKLGCTIPNETLGCDYEEACGKDGNGGRAAALNALFDEWRESRDGEPIQRTLIVFGTVDWLFREYKQSNAYLARVAERSRPDYERTMSLVTDLVTKKGDRVGDRKIRAITPLSVDRIYQLILEGKTNAVLLPPSDGEKGPPKRDRRFGPKGRRPRQAEKAVKLCARAWDVVRRLYPDLFDHEVPNPWRGVALSRRTKRVKSAATREEVYTFAETAIAAGYPEVGAAAVICFEWLQRPENVLAGYIRWTDYRGRDAPSAIRITHHKTGAVVLHPLEDADGTHFYADAEAVLAKVPRRGVPIVMHDARGKTEDGKAKPAALYSASGMAKLVQRLRQVAKLSQTFSLDACRHGGMTELEEAELTDGQGRALSAHTSKAYEGYAKRTMMRALAATRKRHAHRLATASANVTGTEFQNGPRIAFQNESVEQNVTANRSTISSG
jgi:hypothetical protein